MSDFESKTCTGPAHAQPTHVPLTPANWHFYKTGPRAGKPLGRCKLCRHWDQLKVKDGPHGLVPALTIVPLVHELAQRCGGLAEVERRYGLGQGTLTLILKGRTRKMRKRTAQLVLVSLDEQRRADRRNGSTPLFNAARQEQARREDRLNLLAGY